MGFPCFSLTFTVNFSSGRRTLGIEIWGSKIVFGSFTKIGITPYNRKGKSLAVDACGCNNEILINTLGVISLVIGISVVVSPF